jgi:tetratricopeptide (TPR) repeat protein
MKTIDFSYFIERYNAGEMNEAEKTWFQKELSGNLKLREEVDLRRKTDMVLKNRDVIQLRTKLAEIEKKRAAAMPVKNNRKNITLRYAAVIAGLIILGSLALFNGRNMTADDIFNRYYKPYDIASVSRSLNVASNSDYSTAIEYYNVHDYRNAALYFSKVLSSDSRYMESTMLYGIANFEEKNYPVAKQSFRKVIDNNDNLFLEDAQWYLALCYLKTDEKAKAVDQLTLINNSGSLYSNNARKILRKLK